MSLNMTLIAIMILPLIATESRRESNKMFQRQFKKRLPQPLGKAKNRRPC
jgi:hypothetical protein